MVIERHRRRVVHKTPCHAENLPGWYREVSCHQYMSGREGRVVAEGNKEHIMLRDAGFVYCGVLFCLAFGLKNA